MNSRRLISIHVLPPALDWRYAGAYTRFGELYEHRGDAADEKGERVLEHAPGDGLGRLKSSLADRSREIDVRPVAGFKKHPRHSLQAALQGPRTFLYQSSD